jgi:hypothetical protein
MIASEFPVNKSKGHTFSENSRINMKLTKTKTTKEEYLLQKKCELLHFSSFSLPKQNKNISQKP